MGRGGQNEADYADDFSEDDFTEDEADMAEGQNNGEITPSRSTTGEVQWAHATTAAVEGSSSPGGAVAGLGMGLPGLRGKKPAPAIKEWTGLSSFPVHLILGVSAIFPPLPSIAHPMDSHPPG